MSRIAIAVVAVLALAACGKKEAAQPKTEAQVKSERDAATKGSRENAVWGEPLKQMDKAKDLGKDMNKMAEDQVKKAEEGK